MRGNYVLACSVALLWVTASCTESILPLSFRKAPPPQPVKVELNLPSSFRNIFAEDQRALLAFQADQLDDRLRPTPATLQALSPPIFRAKVLDDATNRLFRYQRHDEQYRNPYGFAEDELIDYPDSIYEQRFRQLTVGVPMKYNHQVKNYIDLYASRKRDLTQRMLGKSLLYYPYIEQVLTEKQLPDVLKHLVMVESAMHADAASQMAAVGLWQIRYVTGRSLGLEINSLIDQRLDPYAATRAATDYLMHLHEVYGNWLLAIAGYNCGPGNLNKAIVRSGGSTDFWEVSRYLPQETRSYMPAFMAIIYLNHYQPEHNLRPVYPELSFHAVDTVRIYRELNLEEIAATTAVTLEELTFLNTALIQNKIPFRKEGYTLVIPMDKVAQFEQQRGEWTNSPNLADEIMRTAMISQQRKTIVPQSTNLSKINYVVRRGNTIWGIARRYGCSVKDIQDWNGKSDHVVRVGEELTLYVPEAQAIK